MSGKNVYDTAEKAMKDAFRIFDTDRSGFIEYHELFILLNKLADSFHVEHPCDKDV